MTEAHKNEWDVQKKQIAKDTEVTIATAKQAIKDALKEEKIKLARFVADRESFSKDFGESKSALQGELDGIEKSIVTRGRERDVLVQENIDLTEENRTLNSSITVSKKELDKLEKLELAASERVAALKDQEIQVADDLSSLKDEIDQRQEALDGLTDDFNTKKDRYAAEILVLEGKKQDLSQEIIQNRAEDDKVRENLAVWQQQLEEKDKNLRIREARVSDKEKAIARNYNLLNL